MITIEQLTCSGDNGVVAYVNEPRILVQSQRRRHVTVVLIHLVSKRRVYRHCVVTAEDGT